MTVASAEHILCSTTRLARNLRLAHHHTQSARGLAQWQPLPVMTLNTWLDETLTNAMLVDEFPPDLLPARTLDAMAERLLWEQVIERHIAGNSALELFDIPGMAQLAMEANAYMLGWNMPMPDGDCAEETRHFLQWREAFQALCREHNTLEAARLLNLQIDLLQRSAGRLPASVALAGFDRLSPQERRLIDILQSRGVIVSQFHPAGETAGTAVQLACDDSDAECRLAVAWAAQQLQHNPQAKIAIVAPELSALRNRLTALLDGTLHPTAIHPAYAQMPRCYDFSLGEPLARHPLVAAALALLHLATQRQRMPQQAIRQLLRNPFWSRGTTEADTRALLEARMRRRLPAMLNLEQVLRFVRKAQLEHAGVPSLLEHLESMVANSRLWPKKQLPSQWATSFADLLEQCHWPGERSLSSHEYQARTTWEEVLPHMGGLDAILGNMEATQALRRLGQLCRERIFQPESEQVTALQVMGMLEVPSERLDAIWVMGMNDHLWPPPARPNPLLPAAMQRRHGTPGASSRVQEAFARIIHERILNSAPEVVFSWSHKDGERELRMSPLIAGLPDFSHHLQEAKTLAEQHAQASDMQWLDDHIGPPVTAGEKVGGGAGLLKAQAICPAWGFYQYRLGARALEMPVEGLDSMDRGNLLHAVLQAFWTGRDSSVLQLAPEILQNAIDEAVQAGLREFETTLDEPLSPSFIKLESLRLGTLLSAWLEFEKQRPPFTVQECEREVELNIAGIQVKLKLDRVDELEDGKLVVIDYKTGSSISHNSWADDRISEPQLPIYAALALAGDEVSAVCFAKVRAEEQKFVGIAAAADVLPEVKSLDEARKLFPEDKFPHWHALIEHWQNSLNAIATEIRHGEAAVKFTDENDLAYCEVKPLLRLPERKLQLERSA